MPLLSKHHKELLVSGFIRRNTTDGGNNFSSSISSLFIEEINCHLNDKIIWKIVGEEMSQFSSANPDQSFLSPVIKYDDIEFRVRIFPKGRARQNDDYISLNIELCSKPEEMYHIDTFAEVYLGNNSIFKSNIKYTFNQRIQNNERYREYENEADKIEDGPSNNAKPCRLAFRKVETRLKLSDFIHLNSLSISAEIKILETKYSENVEQERFDDGKNKLKYHRHVETMQHTRYEWKINENILRQFKCASDSGNQSIKLYENEENNMIFNRCNLIDKLNKNWIMSITYNATDENCLLGLHLAILPSIIDKMSIRCRISISFDDFYVNESKSVIQLDNIGLKVGRIKSITFKHPEIKKCINTITELDIKWDIAILQCYDKFGNLIFNDPNHKSILVDESLNA